MRIELFFDFSCPYAYLASTQIEAIAEKTGAELSWKPILLGGLFRAIGNDKQGPAAPPAKAKHNAADMHRWARRWNVPLERPPGHPRRTVLALRTLLGLEEHLRPPAIHAIYRGYWQRGEDISRPEVLARLLGEAGLPSEMAARALSAADEPAVKEELHQRTAEAAERGAFGVPTIFVSGDGDPQMFFGQDRLFMVEAAARGWRQGEPAPEVSPPAGPRTVHAAGAILEFFFDFSSPFAYLASAEVEALAARTGAELRWRPFLLGALFQEIGTADVPLFAMSDAKTRWMAREMTTWAAWRRIPFRMNSTFPLRTVTPLRVALIAGERTADVTHAIFRAAWAEDRNIADEAVLEEVLRELGGGAESLLARTKDPAVKEALRRNTAEAIDRGVFGTPSFFVQLPGEEPALYWGQDRLGLIEEALSA